MAFYNLVDLACRTHTSMKLSFLNLLGDGVVRCKNQLLFQGQLELLATKQHIKAYTSAIASWVKAYITRLSPVAAAAAETGSDHNLEFMSLMLKHMLWTRLRATACRIVQPPLTEVAWEPSGSSSHLMEQVWLSRAVAALAQLLLQSQQPSGHTADDSASSSSSTSGSRGHWGSNDAGVQGNASSSSSGSTGSGNWGFHGAGVQGKASSSSSGSTGSGNWGSHGAGVQGKASSGSTGSGNWGSHSTGVQGNASSSSVGVALPSARPEDKYDVIDSVGVQCALEGRTCLPRARAVEVALSLHMCLSQWHAAATAEHDEQAADKQSVVATTASPSVTVGRAPNSSAVLAPSGADVKQLFGTSMLVLANGLPAAVVDHLEQLKDRWPFRVLSSKEPVEDQQVQLMVLHDAVELCKLLQQEVPVTVGCNNPACLNLQGVAEMVTACKTCLGCQVARYCSRECQVGHWKEHKKICKQLQRH